MAEDKKGFLLYADFIETFEELSDDEAGKLIKHIFRYVNDQNPSTDDRLIKIAFEPIKQQMKRDLIKWEGKVLSKSENGALGNLKRYNIDLYDKVIAKEIEITEAVAIAKTRRATISDNDTSQNVANVAVTDNVTVNVTDTVIKDKGIRVAVATPAIIKTSKKDYDELVKTISGKEVNDVWIALRDFVKNNSPDFIEPYHEIWNLFANRYQLSKIEVITDSRRKKFKSRLAESGFDFIRILDKIKLSTHLKGIDTTRNWRVTFDWIFENDKNYLKILEGNYD